MDDARAALGGARARRRVEVAQARDDLHDDRARVALGQRLHRLEVLVEVDAVTPLEHGRERVLVDLENVVQLDDARVLHVAVDRVLARGVLDVRRLALIRPVRVELVDLDGDALEPLQVERKPHLREAALAEQHQQHVLRLQRLLRAEARALLRLRAPVLAHVRLALDLEPPLVALQVGLARLERREPQLDLLVRRGEFEIVRARRRGGRPGGGRRRAAAAATPRRASGGTGGRRLRTPLP